MLELGGVGNMLLILIGFLVLTFFSSKLWLNLSLAVGLGLVYDLWSARTFGLNSGFLVLIAALSYLYQRRFSQRHPLFLVWLVGLSLVLFRIWLWLSA